MLQAAAIFCQHHRSPSPIMMLHGMLKLVPAWNLFVPIETLPSSNQYAWLAIQFFASGEIEVSMSASARLASTPFSILDLAHIRQGGTPGQAFRNSRALAQRAESLNYNRFWLAEHHNIRGVACSATSVLIGYIANATSKIRVGAGGIMLPNHSPLVIAEQFGTLESLFPGRIDLGVGRAPGGDSAAARALPENSVCRLPSPLTFNRDRYCQPCGFTVPHSARQQFSIGRTLWLASRSSWPTPTNRPSFSPPLPFKCF